MTPTLLRRISRPGSAAALAIVALTSCARSGGGDEGAEVPAVIGARTALAAASAFTEALDAIGTVVPRAGHVAVLSAPTATRVAGVYVATGQSVARGDSLVGFEAAPIAAAAASARADVAAAQEAYDRSQRLVQQGIAPRREMEQAAAELARAGAALAAAERTAELVTLRAPIAGVVTAMRATLGASVDPTQPLVEIADPSSVDVLLALPPDDAARVHPGAKVHLRVQAGGPAVGEAEVVDVSGIVDSTTHAVTVRARASAASRPLRIGETLLGSVVLATRPHAITIPSEALVPEGDGFKVFVVDSGGIAHARDVTVGGRGEGIAEITSGLAAGERVVTYGAYGVTDSARIVPPGDHPAPADSAGKGA